MKKRRTYTTNDSTFASNPGNANLNPFVYIRFFPKWGSILGFSLILSLLLLQYSPLFLFLVLLSIFINCVYWKNRQEHFKFGDSNPGVVVKINPTLVAVATDFTKGSGKYPVVKIIKTSLRNLKKGDAVGTVALYRGTIDDIPHWSDFYPIIIDCATDNLIEIRNAKASYTPKQFLDLEKGISQLQEPYREGLYRVHDDNSNW